MISVMQKETNESLIETTYQYKDRFVSFPFSLSFIKNNMHLKPSYQN